MQVWFFASMRGSKIIRQAKINKFIHAAFDPLQDPLSWKVSLVVHPRQSLTCVLVFDGVWVGKLQKTPWSKLHKQYQWAHADPCLLCPVYWTTQILLAIPVCFQLDGSLARKGRYVEKVSNLGSHSVLRHEKWSTATPSRQWQLVSDFLWKNACRGTSASQQSDRPWR